MLPPALLHLVGGVHVLGADGAAIRLAQGIEQLAQRHGFFAKEGVANVKHGLLVGIGKAVERRIEFRNGRTLGALEGIQIGPALAHVAVGGNQLLHRYALAPQVRVGTGGHDNARMALLGTLGKSVDHRQVRHVFGITAIHCGHMLQGIEVFAPRIRNAAGVGEVVFVHLLDIGGIAAEEIGVALVGLINSWLIAHASLTSAFLRKALLVREPPATRLYRLADATVAVEGPGCRVPLCH